MAENPYVNKIEYAGQTLMDLTGDTVTPSDVLSGITFHDRSGAPQTGNLITHDVYDGLDSTSTSDALSANQGKVLNSKIATDWSSIKSWCKSIESTATTYILKFGRMRTITFQGASRSHTEDEILMTLPQGEIPLATVFVIGVIGSVPVVIRLNSYDGNVALYTANSAGTGRIYFSVSYVVNE